MLSPEELTAWYEQLNLSLQTRSVIDQVRSSEPARRVGGGRRNVSGRYPKFVTKRGIPTFFKTSPSRSAYGSTRVCTSRRVV